MAPRDRMAEIVAWVRGELSPDPHGGGDGGDAYRVSTLYFDTPAFDVFARARSYGRAKYRVRRYGDDGVAFLERKLRARGTLVKWRSAVPLDELPRLSEHGPRHAGWNPHRWFTRRLALRDLRPVCRISYDRIARLAPSVDGMARLTIDSGIRAAPARELRFASGDAAPLLPDAVVVELKYAVRPPPAFKHFAERFVLRPSRCSKYRLAVAALGLAPGVPKPARPEATVTGEC